MKNMEIAYIKLEVLKIATKIYIIKSGDNSVEDIYKQLLSFTSLGGMLKEG